MGIRARIAGVALASAVVVVAAGTAVDLRRQRTAPPPARLVVATVGEGALAPALSVPGRLQPAATRSLYAPLDGIVATTGARRGDRVRRGQLLARLDDVEARVEAARALAALVASNAAAYAAHVAHAELMAHVSPGAKGDPAPRLGEDDERAIAHVLGLSEARLATATAEAAAQAATAHSARRRVARHAIRAPSAGLVLWSAVETGRRTLAGALVFVIDVEPGRLRVVAPVPDERLARLEVGQTATVTVPSLPGRRFAARLSEIHAGAAALGLPGRSEALFTLTEPAGNGLRADMAVVVEIHAAPASTTALHVPAAALDFEPPGIPRRSRGRGEPGVWLLGEGEAWPGTIRRVPVTVGPSDGRDVEIRGSGLHAGQPVVVGLAGVQSRARR